jgi:predicted negative regulator of RcsB-dependent stress response
VLYAQAVAGADSKTALAALQEQFTTTVSVDASGTTAAQLDELAYVSEMRAQLVAAQTTSDEELLTLADSRAGNIRAAALALDAALENRIHIDPHQEIQAQPDEAIPVMVTLTADIPTDTQN